MLDPSNQVTEFDDYKYEFIGKDSPELRAQAAAAREAAIRHAEALRRKYAAGADSGQAASVPAEPPAPGPHEVVLRLRRGERLPCPECGRGLLLPTGEAASAHEFRCSGENCAFRILLD